MGVAVGAVSGLAIFFATAILVIKGGPVVGPTCPCLEIFFYGFDVTWGGAFGVFRRRSRRIWDRILRRFFPKLGYEGLRAIHAVERGSGSSS
jgi:hypothetical protein